MSWSSASPIRSWPPWPVWVCERSPVVSTDLERAMFNYRFDKTGFFAGLMLIVIAAGTVIATVVLLLLGDWQTYGPWTKFVWGLAWVLTIITVCVRVQIFSFLQQRLRRQQPQAEQREESAAPPE